MKQDIEKATEKKILSMAMTERGMKQYEVAEVLGIKPPSLSGSMNRTNIGLNVFAKILDVLDYDIAIIDRRTGEAVWQVSK